MCFPKQNTRTRKTGKLKAKKYRILLVVKKDEIR